MNYDYFESLVYELELDLVEACFLAEEMTTEIEELNILIDTLTLH